VSVAEVKSNQSNKKLASYFGWFFLRLPAMAVFFFDKKGNDKLFL
jgi:hypothetical protein